MAVAIQQQQGLFSLVTQSAELAGVDKRDQV